MTILKSVALSLTIYRKKARDLNFPLKLRFFHLKTLPTYRRVVACFRHILNNNPSTTLHFSLFTCGEATQASLREGGDRVSGGRSLTKVTTPSNSAYTIASLPTFSQKSHIPQKQPLQKAQPLL